MQRYACSLLLRTQTHADARRRTHARKIKMARAERPRGACRALGQSRSRPPCPHAFRQEGRGASQTTAHSCQADAIFDFKKERNTLDTNTLSQPASQPASEPPSSLGLDLPAARLDALALTVQYSTALATHSTRLGLPSSIPCTLPASALPYTRRHGVLLSPL